MYTYIHELTEYLHFSLHSKSSGFGSSSSSGRNSRSEAGAGFAVAEDKQPLGLNRIYSREGISEGISAGVSGEISDCIMDGGVDGNTSDDFLLGCLTVSSSSAFHPTSSHPLLSSLPAVEQIACQHTNTHNKHTHAANTPAHEQDGALSVNRAPTVNGVPALNGSFSVNASRSVNRAPTVNEIPRLNNLSVPLGPSLGGAVARPQGVPTLPSRLLDLSVYRGPALGGTMVWVQGEGLDSPGLEITFGGRVASLVAVCGSGLLKCRAPACEMRSGEGEMVVRVELRVLGMGNSNAEVSLENVSNPNPSPSSNTDSNPNANLDPNKHSNPHPSPNPSTNSCTHSSTISGYNSNFNVDTNSNLNLSPGPSPGSSPGYSPGPNPSPAHSNLNPSPGSSAGTSPGPSPGSSSGSSSSPAHSNLNPSIVPSSGSSPGLELTRCTAGGTAPLGAVCTAWGTPPLGAGCTGGGTAECTGGETALPGAPALGVGGGGGGCAGVDGGVNGDGDGGGGGVDGDGDGGGVGDGGDGDVGIDGDGGGGLFFTYVAEPSPPPPTLHVDVGDETPADSFLLGGNCVLNSGGLMLGDERRLRRRLVRALQSLGDDDLFTTTGHPHHSATAGTTHSGASPEQRPHRTTTTQRVGDNPGLTPISLPIPSRGDAPILPSPPPNGISPLIPSGGTAVDRLRLLLSAPPGSVSLIHLLAALGHAHLLALLLQHPLTSPLGRDASTNATALQWAIARRAPKIVTALLFRAERRWVASWGRVWALIPVGGQPTVPGGVQAVAPWGAQPIPEEGFEAIPGGAQEMVPEGTFAAGVSALQISSWVNPSVPADVLRLEEQAKRNLRRASMVRYLVIYIVHRYICVCVRVYLLAYVCIRCICCGWVNPPARHSHELQVDLSPPVTFYVRVVLETSCIVNALRPT